MEIHSYMFLHILLLRKYNISAFQGNITFPKKWKCVISIPGKCALYMSFINKYEYDKKEVSFFEMLFRLSQSHHQSKSSEALCKFPYMRKYLSSCSDFSENFK